MAYAEVGLELRAWKIVGIVFSLLGGIYAVLGGVFGIFGDGEIRVVGAFFLGFGFLFLVPGVLCLVLESRRKRRVNSMIAAGRYIWGDVIDIVRNPNVRVNGRYLYNVIVRYTDMYGTKHIFKGPNQRIIRDPDMLGKKVKVYIEDDSYAFYYVDTAGLMDHIVEH